MAEQASSDNAFQGALRQNRAWAASLSAKDPSYFQTLASGQSPQILWIGCSDSRVPETTLLDLAPGAVFTHRNIANLVHPTDLSLLSVVEFAVRHLRVRHVVVCGHSSCGGVAAALGNAKLDVLDLWLQPLRALREAGTAELAACGDAKARASWLAKRNVKAGVDHLRRLPTVLEAIAERGLEVHGVLFDLGTGVLEELDCSEDEGAAKERLATFERK